ncbi:lysin A [Microbacterium phage Tyrumbra]|uniref:Lysin A n=1 Tax=Microbacterium phage Tyrumbra TaxID=2596974 RepID=A0A516KPH5_9CAUD|nr:lysin A [Microbacterium phage Tyrumbra]QDP43579.1 lysin A [Microbacterium phage Tyrumbra]
MADAWVWRDGARLTPWMKYQIDRLSAAMFALFGVRVIVSSGIRTYAEQEAIFRARYVLVGDVRGRKVYDTRWWNGRLWYRISAAGTVAAPGSSNHEIQGSRAAVDIRDTGSDAGIMTATSKRGRWIRQHAHEYDLVAEGDGFGEGWHFATLNIWKAVPGGGGSITPPERKDMFRKYHREDATARAKGRELAPGASFYLHTTNGAPTSNASTIVGGVGEYEFVLHVYAEGKPGDQLELVLLWDNTRTNGRHSPHYLEVLTFQDRGDGTGIIRANVPFQRAVAAGYAVYARLTAGAKNDAKAKITLLDSDALLHQ